MKPLIILAGRETEYWDRLGSYFAEQGGYECLVCKREDGLEKELDERHPEFLFREQGFAPGLSFTGKEIIFVQSRQEKGIYMYQNAEQILADMTGSMGKEGDYNFLPAPKSEGFYLVYSPLGRCGKTSFSLALARKSSFFYIGMEEYGIEGKKEHTMDEVLYYIHNRKESIEQVIRECSEEWNGIRMVSSPFCFADLKLLTMDDYRWFFNKLRESEERNSLIVDLGTGCLPGFEFFSLFDRIYIPVLPGTREENKIRIFKELFSEFYGEINENCKFIHTENIEWSRPEFLENVREEHFIRYEKTPFFVEKALG